MLHANCLPSDNCDIIKKDNYGNKDMKMIHLLFTLLFLGFNFSRNLKLSVKLIHDLLEVHHLDPADKSNDRGLVSVFEFPRLEDDAHLLTGLDNIPKK